MKGCRAIGAKISVLVIAMIFAASSMVFASGGKEGGAATGKKVWKIVDVPKLSPSPYFDRGLEGLKQASKDFNIDANQVGAVDFDSAAQVKIIEDLIAKGVDAIMVCAIDPNAMVPVLKKAQQKGILTMAYSSPVEESAIKWDVRSLDDKEFGEHIWDTMVKFMGDSGDYAVLTGQIDTPDHTMWFNYGTAYAKTKYPKLNLVTERIPTGEKLEVAHDKTIDLIKTYPNLKGIIGLGAGNPPGTAQALEEKGLSKKIVAVGTGLPTMCAEGLKNGSLRVVSLWDPYNISYVAAYIAKMSLEGKPIVDGMDIPNMGKIRVKGKVIIPGSYTDFTADNYKNYKF